MVGARRSAVGSAIALLVTSTGTLAALLAVHPHLTVGTAMQNGDDLASGTAWLLAAACAAWLAVTTLASLVARPRARAGIAARIARCGPPIARRLLQTAAVGTFAAMPVPAYATPAAPLVVHVGAGGHLTAVPGTARLDDAPVVRTPPTTTTRPAPRPPATATTAPVPTTTPRTRPPAPTPTVRAPAAPEPAVAPPARRPASASHTLVVRAGDNLWRIARAETARVTGVAEPDNRTVAGYWESVIAANRSTLRSGDPSLIFPGEVVVLPPFRS